MVCALDDSPIHAVEMEDRRQSIRLLRCEVTLRLEGQELPRFFCQIIRGYFVDGKKRSDCGLPKCKRTQDPDFVIDMSKYV